RVLRLKALRPRESPLNPAVPQLQLLKKTFSKSKGTLQWLPSLFDTLEKRAKQVTDSYRTVAELMSLLTDCPESVGFLRPTSVLDLIVFLTFMCTVFLMFWCLLLLG
ncbi:hypothetical protein LINGRAHAP2_LOCUS34927, partial [Linum grandiflorum]